MINRRESCGWSIHRGKFVKKLRKYDPDLFCLNDSQHASDADRMAIKPFLEELFPEKSTFEKTNLIRAVTVRMMIYLVRSSGMLFPTPASPAYNFGCGRCRSGRSAYSVASLIALIACFDLKISGNILVSL